MGPMGNATAPENLERRSPFYLCSLAYHLFTPAWAFGAFCRRPSSWASHLPGAAGPPGAHRDKHTSVVCYDHCTSQPEPLLRK